MKEIFDSIILGIVQGATEFIPVSSSGHLVIVHDMLGATSGTLLFDIFLHLGTLLAVCLYFLNDLKSLVISFYRVILFKALPLEKKFVGMIVLATIPAVVFGFVFSDLADNSLRSSYVVAIALILGSVLMWLAEYWNKKRSNEKDLTYGRSIALGFFQALALIPGVSRSGSTISGGMLLGLSRDKAVRLSFLLSIPIIAGAGLNGLLGLSADNSLSVTPLVFGFVSSFGVGLLAIHFLITYLKQRDLKLFIWYRIILAFLILFIL